LADGSSHPDDRSSINAEDRELVASAEAVIRRNFVPDRHQVGAAARAKSGKVYADVHLESTGVNVCAEWVAVGMAISAGERSFDAIVAVGPDKTSGIARVLSPCGVCRELIHFYGPDTSVIANDDGLVVKRPARDLLPAPWHPPANPHLPYDASRE
jgi:cytidine deaminase